MRVSIVIPIYNVDRYIRQCVGSVFAQIYSDLEIFLIDDGSVDLSGVICDIFLSEDARVTTIHKANAGVSSARNIGLDFASGDCTLFIDGDDWIDEDALQVLVSCLKADSDLDLALFPYKKEYPSSSAVRHIFSSDMSFENKQKVGSQIYRNLFGLTNAELSRPESLDFMSTCWGKLYRRGLVEKQRFIDVREVGSGEDGIFNIYALKNCKKAIYIDKPFYHYRKTAGSLTSKYRSNVIEEWNKLFGYMQEKIYEDKLPPDYQQALNNRIALSILGVGLNGMDDPNGSFWNLIKYIRDYISSPTYRAAIKTMRLKMLPLPWKVLMLCCKCRFGFGVAVILKAIRIIKNRL